MCAEHLNPLFEHIGKLEEALYNIQFEQHWLEAQTDRQAIGIYSAFMISFLISYCYSTTIGISNHVTNSTSRLSHFHNNNPESLKKKKPLLKLEFRAQHANLG